VPAQEAGCAKRDTFLGMMGMPITPSARKVSHEL
jgi:hypothetical protein